MIIVFVSLQGNSPTSMTVLPEAKISLTTCMEQNSLLVVLARPGFVVIMRGIGCLTLHESKWRKCALLLTSELCVE